MEKSDSTVELKVGGENDSVRSRYSSVEVLPKPSASPKIASFFDSFRRAEPILSNQDAFENGDGSHHAGVEISLPLENSLKDRHIRMIAVAGCVGTGLFISLGTALHQAGPAGVLISYAIVSVLLFFVVQSLGELSSAFPTQGNFLAYNMRFIDESWGFAMNWNYYLQWLVTLPLSLVSASLTIEYWGSNINPVVWVTIFYLFIIGLNVFGLKGYGEGEFWFSIIKVVAIVGFCILAVVLICGGSPNNIGYIGAKYWHNPGAFATGFKGVCSVLVNAAFSFAGTELCALAASSAENPRTALPKAVRQVFWRILIFYMLSTTLVCFLVPSNSEDLLSGESATAASPFIIAIKNSGIKALPSIFNVVILLAVLSVANASVFASARPLVAIAQAGHAPKIFLYIDKKGRPLVALAFTFFFGLICFVAASPKQAQVFNWLLALSGLAAIFTWLSISIAHLRVLHAFKVQNISKKELPFVAIGGDIGPWVSIIINVLILIAQFYVGLYPVGGPNLDASVFFQAYLAAPVVLVSYIGHKIYSRNWTLYIKAKDMDLTTGRRIVDIDLLSQQVQEEKLAAQAKPLYYRLAHAWC